MSDAKPQSSVRSHKSSSSVKPHASPQTDHPTDAKPVKLRKFKMQGGEFEIDEKYEPTRPVGHGAYGIVISAVNQETNAKVAIKKISKIFHDKIDAMRVLREIKLLREFDHENIIGIVDIIPPSADTFDDIYVVQELMETDLYRIIYSKQRLSLDHVQYFLYQVLRAVKYIHSANVIHRDLKPSNLLVNSNCDLKICDFGLARGVEEDTELTEYVVTRWYRAPEVMLSCQEYGKAVDLWSIGCIFAELLTRRPTFQGDDYLHQIRVICSIIGNPTDDELVFVNRQEAKNFVKGCLGEKRPFATIFPGVDPLALDLLSRMLQFDPGRRITAADCLRHPFNTSLHHENDEPAANFSFSFDAEQKNLTLEDYQGLIWREIRHFRPGLAATPPMLPLSARSTSSAKSPELLAAVAKQAEDAKSEGKRVDEKYVAL